MSLPPSPLSFGSTCTPSSTFHCPIPTAWQVMEQNKRHLCAFKVLNDSQHEPWRWWAYAAGAADDVLQLCLQYKLICKQVEG